MPLYSSGGACVQFRDTCLPFNRNRRGGGGGGIFEESRVYDYVTQTMKGLIALY